MNNESRTRQNHDDRSLDRPRSDVTTVHRTRFLDKTRAPLPILPKRYNETRYEPSVKRFPDRTTPDTKTHFIDNQAYSEETLKQTLALYSSPTHPNTNARSPIHKPTRIKMHLTKTGQYRHHHLKQTTILTTYYPPSIECNVIFNVCVDLVRLFNTLYKINY